MNRSQQTKALEFENKAPDCGISRIAEVFFQPLGGKLFAAIGSENKLPERPLLLGNLPLPQRLFESLQCPGLRLIFSQPVIHRFRKIDQERRHIQHTADLLILFHPSVRLIIPGAAFLHKAGHRHEQCRRISLLHQIPLFGSGETNLQASGVRDQI